MALGDRDCWRVARRRRVWIDSAEGRLHPRRAGLHCGSAHSPGRHGARPDHVAGADARRPADARDARAAATLLGAAVRSPDPCFCPLRARFAAHTVVDDPDSRAVGELSRRMARRRGHGRTLVRWGCDCEWEMRKVEIGNRKSEIGNRRSEIGDGHRTESEIGDRESRSRGWCRF